MKQSNQMPNELETYIIERDRVLSLDSPTEFFLWATNQEAKFSSSEVAEITRHKMITAATSLDMHLRFRSHALLIDLGYESWL